MKKMKSVLKLPPLVLAGCFLVLSLASAQAEKVLRPKLKDTRLWSDDKFISHSVKMDAHDPHLNFTLNVLQQLHSVDIHVEVSLVQKQNPNSFFKANTTLNLCSILNYSMKSPVGIFFASYIKQYGHIFDKCPINKGTYFLNRIWPPEDSALSHFAETEFVILFTATHVDAGKQQTLIINDLFSGDLVATDVKNAKTGLLKLLPKMF